ncbi:hypothetical protein [Teredinibacter purpureus]|uniref:hypothetical protein n=1 Tax=Teredinibacter purpureus TaxID=2731756 RepID=UPI0013C528C6|nr:hypothetical protein [Teredinibacter purpureus]
MNREHATYKEKISYAFSIFGGVSIAVIAILLFIPNMHFSIVLLPLALIFTSIRLYAYENGFKMAVYFSLFASSLWAGACFLIFIPLGFITSKNSVYPVACFISVGIGCVLLASSFFLGKKLKSPRLSTEVQ